MPKSSSKAYSQKDPFSYEDENTPKTVDLVYTNVFTRNMNCTAREIFNRGSSGSSKSHSLAQLMWYKMLTEKKKKILIVRKSLPFLRISTLVLMRSIMDQFGITHLIKEEKVGLNMYYEDNENWIHFGSLDDPQKIKCGIEGTEILTENGFIDISKAKVGDKVASLNPETNEVIYAPITKTFVYDYEGDIYVPDKNKRRSYVDFGFTPEHKFIGCRRIHKGNRSKYYYEMQKPEFIEAKNLPSRFYIPRGGKWEGDVIDAYIIPNTSENKRFDKTVSFPIIPWLRFLGWYISEGSVSGTQIDISQTKEKGKIKFIEDMKDFPSDYSIKYTGHAFKLHGRSLSDYVLSLGKYCYEKRIPREILNLHPSLLKYLFDSLVEGDGTIHKSGRIVYSTTSEGLKDDICELSLKLGLTPTVLEPRTDYKSNYANGRKSWSISISKQDSVAIKKPITKQYKGKVYCLEVEPYHTFLTRFNGRVIWTGNSSEWNIIWVEEATEFTYEDYQLMRLYNRAKSHDGKPNQMFMSFNPVDERHWIKKEVLDKVKDPKQVVEIHSTYKDNPFLPQESVERIEALQDQDYNYYRVMGLGEWGKLENLIYSNWRQIPFTEVNDGEVVYGLDFGYNAESALIKCIVDKDKKDTIYEEQLIYKKKLTNSDLIALMKRVIPKEHWRTRPIYADPAEPDRIKEIHDAGFQRIKGANKNILDGIDFVKRLKIYITDNSPDLVKEKTAYCWKKDRMTEEILDEPVDYSNHLMDAERYAIYSHLRGVRDYQVRWL